MYDHYMPVPRLELSRHLLEKLRARRARQPADELELEHDAFLLDPGLGPPTYVTSDGRILFDERWFCGDAIVEAQSQDQVIVAFVVGAKKTRIAELLELVPPRPPDGFECPECHGTRWWPQLPIVCFLCRGRGWALPPMVDAFAERVRR